VEQEMTLIQNGISNLGMGVAMSGNGKPSSEIEVPVSVDIPNVNPFGSLPEDWERFG
jgi:hypothetical protein